MKTGGQENISSTYLLEKKDTNKVKWENERSGNPWRIVWPEGPLADFATWDILCYGHVEFELFR